MRVLRTPAALCAQGFRDDQLLALTKRVLCNKRIWALNVGENYGVSMGAWQYFKDELPNTAVAYLYVSEHHLLGTTLKEELRDAIRANRKRALLLPSTFWSRCLELLHVLLGSTWAHTYGQVLPAEQRTVSSVCHCPWQLHAGVHTSCPITARVCGRSMQCTPGHPWPVQGAGKAGGPACSLAEAQTPGQPLTAGCVWRAGGTPCATRLSSSTSATCGGTPRCPCPALWCRRLASPA